MVIEKKTNSHHFFLQNTFELQPNRKKGTRQNVKNRGDFDEF